MRNFIIISIWLVVSIHHIQAQRMVEEEKMVAKEGVWYAIEESKPFTGKMVTYHCNGIVEGATEFKDSKRTGKMETFYDSGNLKVQHYENEKHETFGPIQIWNEDGTVAFQGEFKAGKMYKTGQENPFSGVCQLYYRNGALKEEGEFVNGRWHGKQTWWSREGKKVFTCYFEDNIIKTCVNYDKQGKQIPWEKKECDDTVEN